MVIKVSVWLQPFFSLNLTAFLALFYPLSLKHVESQRVSVIFPQMDTSATNVPQVWEEMSLVLKDLSPLPTLLPRELWHTQSRLKLCMPCLSSWMPLDYSTWLSSVCLLHWHFHLGAFPIFSCQFLQNLWKHNFLKNFIFFTPNMPKLWGDVWGWWG